MLDAVLFAAGVLVGATLVYALLRDARAAHARERREWWVERGLLLNRIKPETAQFVAADDPVSAPPAVGFDDDDAYWKAGESKDELARRAFMDELSDATATSPLDEVLG